MKGVIFSKFIDHVDHGFGAHIAESMISKSELPSGGAYTTVGTYNCSEMVTLVETLSELSGENSVTLIHGFGESLAQSFYADHPEYFDPDDFFDFIESIDSHIHVQVHKLYPDAELPKFLTVSRSEKKIVIDYVSSRGLEVLACGLFSGTAKLYEKKIQIGMVPRMDGNSRVVRITIDVL